MAKLNLNFKVSTLESKTQEVSEMITKAGKYAFTVVKAMLLDSRTNPDGSVKKSLPSYVDATPEIYCVGKDIISGKIHIFHVALASYRKFKEFSEADIKENKITKDARDGYALVADKQGNLHRIPAHDGEGYEAVLSIYSRFTQALGLPEGTTPEQVDEFVSRSFKGELEVNEYTSHDQETKTRLKLKPNFYPVSEEELEQLRELAEVAQSFN